MADRRRSGVYLRVMISLTDRLFAVASVVSAQLNTADSVVVTHDRTVLADARTSPRGQEEIPWGW